MGSFEQIYCQPPERLVKQDDNKTKNQPSGDMWSLGVILYILICGYPPFKAKNLEQLKRRITNQPLKFNNAEWQGVSKSCKQILKKMLQKNATDRITFEQALSH